jgi:tetratricopeptide (TPR) repeat protein
LEGRLARLAPSPLDAARRASLLTRIAHELDAIEGDPEAAVLRLQQGVRELGPLPALTVPLAALLRRLAHWDALIALCREAAAACADPREQAAWQLLLAEACEGLGEIDAAVQGYHAVLAVLPRELRALHGVQRLHRTQGDAAALARALESELALRAGTEEISLRLELAELLAGPLARGAEALRHLRRVLDLDPHDASSLERALTLADALGSAPDQVALLEIASRRAAPHVRARLLARQAALLAGPLESPEQAILRWRGALELDPSAPGAYEGLRTALERIGDWVALLECLLDEGRTAGAERRLSLLEQGARVATERFGRDAALPWLERLRAEAPHDATILARLAELHRGAGRREALLAVLEAELGLSPTPERAQALESELAAIARPRSDVAEVSGGLDAPFADRTRRSVSTRSATLVPEPGAAGSPPPAPASDGARPSFILEPAPPSQAPASGGPSTRTDPASISQAAEVELARLDAQEPVFAERRRALQRELAHLYTSALPDNDRALPHLRALVTRPADARRVEGFEAERAWAEERLLALLREDESWLELAERLAARLAHRPDDGGAWLELAQLRERHLRSPAAAADAYREAISRGGHRRLALAGLRRVSEALGDWREVARSLELELQDEMPAPERADLLRVLGEVSWRRLGNTTRASRAFAGALEANPRDLISLRALQELLASMEDWRGALDLIESEIELLASDAAIERRQLLLRAAEIAAERVADPARAIRALDAAHQIAPLEREARMRLAEHLYACGDCERFVEVATVFCDEPESDPAARLRLARALFSLGRFDAARARAKSALFQAPRLDAAWELLADVEWAQGRRGEAAESLLRAAETSPPRAAIARLLRAASLVEIDDPEYAHALRERACGHDVASLAAREARARSALRLGRAEEAEGEAVRAVELAVASGPDVEAPTLLDTALHAVTSARAAGRLAVAARALAGIRALAPSDPGVLREQAEVLHALGDRFGARRAVEALFAADEGGRKEARLLVIQGEGLEGEAALDDAVDCFEEAARLDPGLGAAWAALARAHEQAGRPIEAARALDGWADTAEGEVRIACRLRAAELELLHDAESALPEQRLRALLAVEPACERAALLLAERRLERGDPREALAVAAAALAQRPATAVLAALERLRARALEALGQHRDACAAHEAVLAVEPDAIDAALSRAALQRGRGAWDEAARGLEAFLARGPSAPDEALAQAWLELGQLRAGPLANKQGAILAQREAVRLRPGSRAAREALADLLAADPTAHDEAVARQLELLELTPERVESLQALTRLAEAVGGPAAAADGRAILRAIGAHGPEEADTFPSRLAVTVAASPALENPVWERARLLARVAAPEIARALLASCSLEPPLVSQPVEAFRLAAVVAEAALAAAPLVPLTDAEAGAVLATVAGLAARRDALSGDGRLVNALAGELDRSARRRVREALGSTAPEEIAEIDFTAWRSALRSLAHAVALDATRGDLRAALVALIDEHAPARFEPWERVRDLRAAVAATPTARELLRRSVVAWGRTIVRRKSGS